MHNPNQFEHVAAIANIPLIKTAIAVSGIKCKLFKMQYLIQESDEVYGIYAGNAAIEEATNLNEIVNPYGTMTIDSIEQEYGEGSTIKVEDAFESDQIDTHESDIVDRDMMDGEDIKVLFTGKSWRVISSGEYGFYDSDDYLWTDGSIQIDNGDVLLIDRQFGGSVKFKITYIESLGMTTNIVQRFKIANLG